jgi:cysteine desulfurase/selenocysteine lyase
MNTPFPGQPVLDPVALRGDFPILDQEIHRQKPLIYFDNAATTQHPRQVLDEMNECYQRSYSNVHRGFHWLSEQSSRLYEDARVAVQKFIGARWSEEVLFTSGTTLGINAVARSWGDQNVSAGDEILLSIMEHHSNIVPWQQLAERSGAVVRFFGITDDGQPDLEDYARLLNKRTKIVGITAVSNTFGTIVPVAKIVEKAHAVGAIVVVDAAQHVPHSPTDVTAWNPDFLAFSGHKMLGPSGIGVLYGKRELLEAMPPFLGGGSMIDRVTTAGFTPGLLPAKFEAGTPPIVEAIGLAAAIRYLNQVGLNRIEQHERALAAIAHARMSEIDGLTILGPSPDLKCGIVSFVVDGVSAQDLSILVDLQGVAIRVGHHCTMPLHEYLNISASCRASFYLYNTADEVHRFVDILQEVLPKLR